MTGYQPHFAITGNNDVFSGFSGSANSVTFKVDLEAWVDVYAVSSSKTMKLKLLHSEAQAHLLP